MTDDFWGDPIDKYTDGDALDDGVIVDISAFGLSFRELPINRITSNLLHDLGLADQSQLPLLITGKLPSAHLSGGIWTLPPRLWLIDNELGGWTLMLPEDY